LNNLAGQKPERPQAAIFQLRRLGSRGFFRWYTQKHTMPQLATLRPTFVCVMQIRSGEVLYHGTCYGKAAQALDPGTCYGRGWSLEEARREAIENRKQFQRRAA
jgi:hypothetical protein